MEARKPQKRFSKEVRANIVKLVVDGGRTCPDVAKQFDIPVANAYGWVRQSRADAEMSQRGEEQSLTEEK